MEFKIANITSFSEEDSKVKPTPAEEPKVNKKEIIEINLKEEANLSTDDDDDKLVIKVKIYNNIYERI